VNDGHVCHETGRDVAMSSIQENLSIFNKFKFERKPVGVKFSRTKPDGIKRLDKLLDFCEMLVEAQNGKSFYVSKKNFTCPIGPLILGMVDSDPVFESGRVGPKLEIFKDARANRGVYQVVPRFAKGTVKYVAFSPLDKLSFEPDVLIITANLSQIEILLRATSYSTGKVWSSKGTVVMGCAWLYVYPSLSGGLNLTLPSFGMRARNLFPEGLLPVSIPWNLLPSMVRNLQDMNWVPHSYTIGREQHKRKVKRIVEGLRQEIDC
jgi:uncharacterized protein (DUF169 family)